MTGILQEVKPKPAPPKKFKARSIWFPSARQVELRDEDIPEVGDADIHIHTIASGLSSGTELLVYRGEVPAGLELDLPTLRGQFSFPIKYGYACVGRVVARGRDVDRVRAGDLVFVHHPHQTQFVAPASMAVKLRGDLDPQLGIFFANTETAVNVTLDAHPHLGDRVAIFGQGVVGLLITQMMKRAGAQVLTVDPVELRRDLARAVGADVALDVTDELDDRMRESTEGQGPDIVIEASGNPAALDQAMKVVGREGKIVVASWYGSKTVHLDLGSRFHRERIKIVSSQVGSLKPELATRWTRERRAELARQLLPDLVLDQLVTHRLPFENAAQAYDLLDRHPDETVQVVLTYEDDV